MASRLGKALFAIDAIRTRQMATFASSALSTPMTLNSEFTTKIPKLVYGTAWKKERTSDLVYSAIKAGLRGIDTAAQPRHYREELVGDGIRKAIKHGLVRRDELYIQTKFTGLSGQDPQNMPYHASAPLAERIHTSFQSSFKNLRHATDLNADETYLDCLVLHSPFPTIAETHEAWSIFSSYVPHRIRSLGISNTTLPVLQSLYATSSVKPCIVQNRFYPDTSWEVSLRKFCRERSIVFQSFWTLTGNPALVRSHVVQQLASDIAKVGVSSDEVLVVALYALVLGLEGVTVLDGTTKTLRMKLDLDGVEAVGKWAEGEGRDKWEQYLAGFKHLIGESVA